MESKYPPLEELDFSKLSDPVDEIYQGPASRVYTANWSERDNEKVVVKKTRICSPQCLNRFSGEVDIFQKIMHPSIMRPLAICSKAPNYVMVLPYMQRGSLHDILHDPSSPFSSSSEPPLPFALSLCLAIDIAKGIASMHDHRILHRDIKPANILCDNDWAAKVTDFDFASSQDGMMADYGLKKYANGRPTGGWHKAFIVGSLPYMAPEILLKAPFSQKADVYSLGISLNELVTGCIPYSDVRTTTLQMHTVLEANYNQATLMNAIATENVRPNIPTGTSDPIREVPAAFVSLVQACWDADENKRPTADQVVKQLESLAKSMGIEVKSFDRNTCATPSASALAKAEQSASSSSLPDGTSPMDTTPVSSPVPTPPTIPAQAPWVRKAYTYQQTAGVDNKKPQQKQDNDNDDNDNDNKSDSKSDFYLPEVDSGVFDTCGHRGADRMEDRNIFAPNLHKGQGPPIHLWGVFDGHGGKGTPTFVSTQLLPLIKAYFTQALDKQVNPRDNIVTDDMLAKAAATALDYSFQEIDFRWLSSPRYKEDFSGSTGIVAMIVGRKLVVANIGDCRAVVSIDGVAKDLSTDHLLEIPEERARVEASGGEAKRTSDGTLRVQGIIQVTRSFGDRKLKPFGLIAKPEITIETLTDQHSFLIMATDGIWDVMSSQQAVVKVLTTVKTPVHCTKRLVYDAFELQSQDNMTVIVAFLTPKPECEVWYSGSSDQQEQTRKNVERVVQQEEEGTNDQDK